MVKLSQAVSYFLVPTLRVGMQLGRSAARPKKKQAPARDGTQSVQNCVPTQSVGTRRRDPLAVY
jgi:hypothetical protein